MVANEQFMAWLTGQKSMPFGPDGEHTTVRLIDFDHPDDASSNQWMVSTEVTFAQGRVEKRFDLVLWCNGFPLVVGEAKTPVRAAYTWIDARGADPRRLREERAAVLRARTCSRSPPRARTSGTARSGCRWSCGGRGVRRPPTRTRRRRSAWRRCRRPCEGVLTPAAVLEFLRFFTIYATDKKFRKIKIIARFQQFQATNLIVERVLLGKVKQGLIWHFQGSGKSLLMVFTALKLRAMAALTNPTILIVVDRIDLDTQITGTFHASDVPGHGVHRLPRPAADAAEPGGAEDHHHDDPQVR